MKKNLFVNFGVLFLLAILTISPNFASADNVKGKSENKNKVKIEKMEKKDSKEKENDNDDNKDKSSKKCLTAYGHLFAFGWLKKNAKIEIGSDCFLPFGIAKKFRGTASTTPPTLDTLAPVITNLTTNTNTVNATIHWFTDEKSDSSIFWSTQTGVNVNSSSTLNVVVQTKTKNHSVVINGLSASTTYYAIVRSRDSSGNTSYSSEFSFTTKSPVVVGDTTSPIVHSIVAVVGTSTANIGWQTNEPATSKVYYSTTSPLSLTASSTNFVQSGSLTAIHLLPISNLATSTTYYLVVESKDAALNSTNSSQFQFTTASGI